jgi:hypothetical protein
MGTIKSEQCIAKRILKYILDGISYEIHNVHESQDNAFYKEIVIAFTASGYSRFDKENLSISFTFYCDLPEDDVYVKSITITTFFGPILFHKVYHRCCHINDMMAGRATKSIEELEIKMDLLGV